MGFTTINIPKIPNKTAIQLDKLTYSFNNHGERIIVNKGSIDNIIVASARGSLDREAKKKYVINKKTIWYSNHVCGKKKIFAD